MTARRELRDRDAAFRWLSLGALASRLVDLDGEGLGEAATWLAATARERPALPPAGVIFDIGRLLSGAPLRAREGLLAESATLQRRLRRFEDRLLGRLVREALWRRTQDAIAALAPSRRGDAVGLVVASILDRVLPEGGVEIPQGAVRSFAGERAEAVLAEGLTALAAGDALIELVAGGYDEVLDGAAGASALLTDGDVALVENLDVLSGLSQRIALAQISDAAQELSRHIPRRLRSSRPGGRGNLPTTTAGESTYPVGGFAALTTAGGLESLLTSELANMDPPDGATPRALDLFDQRFAAGELLHYQRDESLLYREQREVVFWLRAGLATARQKDRGHSRQRLVLVLALVVAVIRALTRRLGHDGLTIEVVFERPSAGGPLEPLEDERRVLALLLRQWIERGTVTVRAGARSDERQRRAAAPSDAGRRVIVVGDGDSPEGSLDRLTESPDDALVLAVDGARPRVHGLSELGARRGEPPSVLEAWGAAAAVAVAWCL